jgi:osmotically-inducible protein OsmY
VTWLRRPPIEIDVGGRDVTLRGDALVAERQAILGAAAATRGVNTVIDRIRAG